MGEHIREMMTHKHHKDYFVTTNSWEDCTKPKTLIEQNWFVDLRGEHPNPCYKHPHGEQCTVNFDHNQCFEGIRRSQINHTCPCENDKFKYVSNLQTCVDRDECFEYKNICNATTMIEPIGHQQNIVCRNTFGSYVCECEFGYEKMIIEENNQTFVECLPDKMFWSSLSDLNDPFNDEFRQTSYAHHQHVYFIFVFHLVLTSEFL
ncbi:unnamed protein product [Didymodactylos carnosus]|uniref:YTH domain-containing protein n=1 Tax=Didymodactylos carnosus TaxID=1234261 RepID=A0A8S2J1I3_9BILA|nr:unnamed protein product [Didymodactylos carnosus]CAF3790578.1 unnamed protein product [Didymodactylos carnosus]